MKLRSLAVNLLVLVGSLCFLFGLLELGSRIFVSRPPTVLVDNVQHDRVDPTQEKEFRTRRGLPGLTLFKLTDTGMRLYPNVRMIIRGHELSRRNIEVRTNALGYRGDDVPPKGPQDFRVLVLGDSITLADYVPEEQTYPAVLERRLLQLAEAGVSRDATGFTPGAAREGGPQGGSAAQHSPLKTKNLRVINAGTSSIDLRSELMILMETGLSTKPDVVVVGLYLNDADVSFALGAVTYPPSIRWSRFLTYLMSRTDYLKTMLRYREREKDRKEEKDHFVAAHAVSETADWHDDDQGFNREIAGAFGDWGYAWTGDAWRKMEETLTLMKQVAADHDFELFVALLPVRQQVQSKILRDEPQRAFERSMRRLGLPHLDLLGPMRESYAKDGHDIYFDHCHYRAEGNELVGRLIADALADQSRRLAAIGVSKGSGGDVPPFVPSPRPSGALRAIDLLNKPQGLAVTPAGEVLIVDVNEGTIERAAPDGRFLPPLGRESYNSPNGVAVDAKGIVYVADTWNQRIVRLSPDGSPMGDLPTPAGGFYAPRDVAIAPEGDAFVANTGRSRIERYDAAQRYVAGWGEAGSAEAQFREPLGVAAGGHEVYALDYGNARIQVFTFGGRFLRSWPVPAWRDAPISNRPAIVFHGDRIYATDPVGNQVLVFSTRGQVMAAIQSPELQEPAGLAVGRDGRLYVANIGSGAIAVVSLAPSGGAASVRRFAPITSASKAP